MMTSNHKTQSKKNSHNHLISQPQERSDMNKRIVTVDVIVPVHNAEFTIVESITSAWNQEFPESDLQNYPQNYYSHELDLTICCHDDGSTDRSLELLYQLQRELTIKSHENTTNNMVRVKLLISSSPTSRGAGFARNEAAQLNRGEYLAMLDSDDVMYPTRIVEQVAYLLSLSPETQRRTLLGCHFQRDPPDSTWHYSKWANSLTEERRMLERFREVTVIQPTWMITRQRFEALGGYIVVPENSTVPEILEQTNTRGVYPLVSKHDTLDTLRLAEDLRFFHAHLAFNFDTNSRLDNNSYYPSVSSGDGLLKIVETPPTVPNTSSNSSSSIRSSDTGTVTKNVVQPLLLYRHVPGGTQSSRTSRKLLLQLRTKAFEDLVIRPSKLWSEAFAIWGAGRDGRDFFKALSPDIRVKVKCFVDVDDKKINQGYYTNRDLAAKIPIVHFSALIREGKEWVEHYSHIHKKKCTSASNVVQFINKEKCAREEDYAKLPVVVCVAMYRTNGALEKNCETIGRKEGVDLWHFS